MTPAERQIKAQYAATLLPPREESIAEWAKREIELDATSPITGKYDVSNSPYLEEPLEAWRSKTVRMITTIGPNQGGRTKAMEVASLWSIANSPGPTQWNTYGDERSNNVARQRWWPMARKCNPVMEKVAKSDLSRLQSPNKIIFTDGMPLTIQGANEGNLQENSIRNQFNDECFQWGMGLLRTAWKRCDVSYAWNHKIWNGSTGADEGQDIEEAYLIGDCREWTFQCLDCGHAQAWQWGEPGKQGGIKWESSERTRPDGMWDFEAVKETVHYECEQCGHKHPDDVRTRRLMNATSFYKPMREDITHKDPIEKNGRTFYPFRDKVSFRYNILCVNWPGVRWATWVEEFLLAVEQARSYANYEPLKLFWCRRMADFWNETKRVHQTSGAVKSDYAMTDPDGRYIYQSFKWEDEAYRFASADKQESTYFLIIRAVKRGGDSRLIYRGECASYDEIEEKAKQFDVKPKCVLMDCGFERREVFAEVAKRGWTAMSGDDRSEWTHIVENPQTKQRVALKRPYSKLEYGDPCLGSNEKRPIRPGSASLRPFHRVTAESATEGKARLYAWGNLPIKDMLSVFRQGRASIYWGIPEDVGETYLAHLKAEVRYKKVKPRGGIIFWWSNRGPDGKRRATPDHFKDCECQIIVALLIQGLIDIDKWQTGSINVQRSGHTRDDFAEVA